MPGALRTNPKEEKYTMTNMKQLVKNLINEDSGQDLIEYALVAALVGLGAVAAMKGLSNSIGTAFNGVGNSLANA
jgi:pilus assembly protein Flp/PilA